MKYLVVAIAVLCASSALAQEAPKADVKGKAAEMKLQTEKKAEGVNPAVHQTAVDTAHKKHAVHATEEKATQHAKAAKAAVKEAKHTTEAKAVEATKAAKKATAKPKEEEKKEPEKK